MVRVYTQPGARGLSTLGGVYGGSGYNSGKPLCMQLLSPGPVMHDLGPRAPVLHPPELHHVPDPRVLVHPGAYHQQQHQEPHFGELGDVPQPLPSELPPQHQMKVPVSIGICKMCRRVYRPETGGGVDYEEILSQKRRDEARYRHGQDYGGIKAAASDGFLNRAGQPANYEAGLSRDLEEFSQALARIQNTVAPDNPDHPQAFSYPTSAINGHEDYSARKTWSAPNKDPLGGGGLEDPFQRRSGRHQQGPGGASAGYEPSFGGGGDNRRGHRRGGGGTGEPPPVDRRSYLSELSQQVEEQQRRRARETAEAGGQDWWEKKRPAEAEYKAPHPNQDIQDLYRNHYGTKPSERKTRNKNNDPSSYDRPDPAEARRRYEQELKEQMDAKKKLDDERKRKQREEDEKLEKRMQEQQEKMQREFEEEQNKKKEKERAKLKKQEMLAERQMKLKEEMDRKKKEEDMRRLAEKRGPSRQSTSRQRQRSGRDSAGPAPATPQYYGLNYRTDSPPIPTMRGQEAGARPEASAAAEDSGTRPASPGVVDQLASMRHNLDRRRESLQYEDEKLGAEWSGLAEL